MGRKTDLFRTGHLVCDTTKFKKGGRERQGEREREKQRERDRERETERDTERA